MNRQSLSDWLLVASIAAGLFFAPAFGAIFVALAVRLGGKPALPRPDWNIGHLLQLLSALWGLGIVAARGVGDSRSLILQYVFIWVVPVFFTLYRPDARTVGRFAWFLVALFAVDLLFNLYAATTGADLFRREVDQREGVAGGRYGGLFSHSFYSGSISMLAYAVALTSRGKRWLLPLTIANLLLAGSWRFSVAIVLLPLLLLKARGRTFGRELLLILAASGLLVASVFMTSSVLSDDLNVEANPSNDLRIVAWATAIEKIVESPLVGVGFPSDRPEDGMSATEIDNSLIAESWYLTAALTFGMPYLLLRLGAYLVAFYRGGTGRRGMAEAILVPFLLIDLTYGGAMEGALVYSWVWILVCSKAPVLRRARRRRLARLAAATPLPARA